MQARFIKVQKEYGELQNQNAELLNQNITLQNEKAELKNENRKLQVNTEVLLNESTHFTAAMKRECRCGAFNRFKPLNR